MDPKKVKVIINWQEPKNIKDVKVSQNKVQSTSTSMIGLGM